MSWIVGSGRTSFGRHEGIDTLGLMADATQLALDDADLKRADIDGVLTGYSTTMPHLMLATLFSEHFGLQAEFALATQLGGATGGVMAALAHDLVAAGRCRKILVVAGENRLTGQSRDSAIQTLAQVGHRDYEVPLGATIPSYYALLASEYMNRFGCTGWDLAELAVLMRQHASATPGAQYRTPISVNEVMDSRVIANPLRLLDCCPISDGAVALVVSSQPRDGVGVKIRGTGQGHLHQHVSAIKDIADTGAAVAVKRAGKDAGMNVSDVTFAAIYDSFTITLVLLLEELGLTPRGTSGAAAREGRFALGGSLPLNTHGGLLSYGHCGVGGGLAHLAEIHRQMKGGNGARQVADPSAALFHADGGVLSSHISIFLSRELA